MNGLLIDKLEDLSENGEVSKSILNILEIQKVSNDAFLFYLKPRFVLFNMFPSISEIEVKMLSASDFKLYYYFNSLFILFFFMCNTFIFLSFIRESLLLGILVIIESFILVTIKIIGYKSLKKRVFQIVNV